MSITKEEIQHIAHLARLGLSNEQLGKTRHDFDEILGYIDKLNEADSYYFNVEKSMKRLSHHYLFASLSLHGTMRQVKTFKMTTGAIYQIIIIIFKIYLAPYNLIVPA